MKKKRSEPNITNVIYFPLDASLLSTIEEQLFISDDMTSYWLMLKFLLHCSQQNVRNTKKPFILNDKWFSLQILFMSGTAFSYLKTFLTIYSRFFMHPPLISTTC